MHAIPIPGATDSAGTHGILAMGERVLASVPAGTPTHRIVRVDQDECAHVQ